MKMHYCAAIALALLAAGCQNTPVNEQLKTEMRYLEDQLYWYDDEYRQKCAELESCRRENKALRAELGHSAGAPLPNRAPRSASPGSPAAPTPRAPVDEAPRFRPPSVEPGIPTDAPPPLDTGISAEPASLEMNHAEQIPAGRTEYSNSEVDAHITHIVLNSRLTGGYDFDGRPGDEGLQVVIEPRNAAGRYVALGGPVSVVVLDPARQGPDARIARWDFDATETTPLLKRTMLGRGIHLELPWPAEPPENTRLHVYVRYVTIDGRKLEADRKLTIELTGELSSRWTPAAIPGMTRREPNDASAPAQVADVMTPHAADVTAQQVAAPLKERADSPAAPAELHSGESRSVLVTAPASPLDPQGRAPVLEATRRRPTWQPHR